MEIQDYLDLFTGDKQNKLCRVVTTAKTYEGVYLRSICPDKELAIVIRPTGITREELKNVTCPDNPECDPTKEVAIPVAVIKEVAFDE